MKIKTYNIIFHFKYLKILKLFLKNKFFILLFIKVFAFGEKL